MPAKDLHLSIEVGPWWTTAVYERAGVVHPVYFDGQPRLPSGVHQQPGTLLTGTAALTAGMDNPGAYHPDPLALLHSPAAASETAAGDTAAGGTVDPVDATAAVLTHVARTATTTTGGRITELTLVTAHAWGPQIRQRLQQAATTAGLPDPNIATVAAALATTATGRYVVTATSDLDLTVLDREEGFQQVAYLRAGDPHADGIDRALFTRATGGTPPAYGWQWAREINQARAALATQARVALLLPPPHRAAALDREDVSVAAAAHLDRLPENVKTLITDAGLTTADVSTVVLRGGDAVTAEFAAGLQVAGLPVPTVLDDPHAVARGGLQLTKPLALAPTGTAASVRLPRARLTVANLVRVVVLAGLSAALLHLTIDSAYIMKIGITVRGVMLPTPTLSLAAALAALTAWSAAQLAPTTWILAPPPDDRTTAGILLRQGFLGAAALSLAAAGLWALATMVSVGLDTTDYLRATFIAATPIAASAAVIALFAARIPATALLPWLHRISPPLIPIALGSTGIYLHNLQHYQVTGWWKTLVWHAEALGALAEYGGAILLGIATAMIVARGLFLRVAAGALLTIGYAAMAGYTTAGYTHIAYVIAVVWWAVAAAFATVTTTSIPAVAALTRWFNPPS
ncbi:hypothetical protein [Actinoplanes couchii]|uniref:Hsp70 protein n=1 Tax=Actinoplanes couchii TaxID=403638 RepID=A0ABQ3XNY9_9ACTN|nr:hypothetical protein [Actinoplanes couchii]MDR6318592.1 hypothetical protein [Actinoplanes couchii]GID60201.1 hypothetical protein Aco03nite_086050 [Actinoplanes couchii]